MGIKSSDVTYAGCSTSSAVTFQARMISILAVASVSANMKVDIPLSQFAAVTDPSNSSSVANLFNNLQQQLINAVESGDFTKQLSATSKYLKANATSKAVVTKTSTSGMVIQNPPTAAPIAVAVSNKSSVNMSIIIGVVSGVAFLLLIAVCFLAAYVLHLSSDKVVSTNNPVFSATKETASERDDVTFGRDRVLSSAIAPDLTVTESSCAPCCV
jgi:hypothetical protein